MLKKGLLWILLLIPLVYLLLCVEIIFFIQHHSYRQILDYYTTHWPLAFDTFSFAEYCFTPQWYSFINAHATAIELTIITGIVVYVFLIRAVKRIVQHLWEDVYLVGVFMKRTFTGLSNREKWMLLLLLGLIAGYRLYFYNEFPLHSDEAGSYLFFVRPGPFIAITSYPLPNNHVFFNEVCSILAKLSFLSAKFIMRAPVISGDLLLLYGLFCVFKHFGNFARAIFTVAGVAFCYLLSYYATQGRGYQWQEICAVVSAGCCWWYFFSPVNWSKKGYGLFIASSVIGFYVNPLFLYHFLALMLAALFLFIKKNNRAAFSVFVKTVVAIMLFTFVLYLPLILGSSWNGVVNNRYIIINRSLSDLTKQVSDLIFTINYIINYGSLGIYILPACFVFALVLYNRKYIKGIFYDMMLVYFVATVLSFIGTTLYTKVYPLERGLCFWVLIINIIFVNVLYDFCYRFFPGKAWQLLSLFVFLKAGFSVRLLYWPKYAIGKKDEVVIYNQIQPQFSQLSALGVHTWQITDSDDYYSMFLPLYLTEHNKKEDVIWNRKMGVGDVVFLPDTYRNGFDLAGYRLWKDKQVTAHGRSLAIYVKEFYLNK